MTTQISERLIYNGTETKLRFCPELPKNHPRIIETLDRELCSSMCFRMYVGTWEVKDGKLYLINISGKYELDSDEPLFADWITGAIIFSRGEFLKFVGRYQIHEEDVRLTIENGILKHLEIIDNRIKYGIVDACE